MIELELKNEDRICYAIRMKIPDYIEDCSWEMLDNKSVFFDNDIDEEAIRSKFFCVVWRGMDKLGKSNDRP